MKKKIIKKIACMIILLNMPFVVSSCCTAEAANNKSDRMVYVETICGSNAKIYYDKYTKVMYIISNGYYNAGTATVMLDEDGTPLLYEDDD